MKAFLKASLAWLAAGVTLGVAMAAHPAWTIYRPVHLHMVLLGFVTMMIYGVAYHVIPRFSGHPLYGRRGAGWHWWLSNVGLSLMAVGFAVRMARPAVGTPVLAAGGVLSALGAYAFVFLIWRTIDGARARSATVTTSPAGSPAARTAPAGRSRLPLAR